MPENQSIESLMKAAMESIREMVDVNTVIGEPVETPDGTVIIPVSRVTCGFIAGGSVFESKRDKKEKEETPPEPDFGGGSGAGVSVKPVGFLVVGNGQVRMVAVDKNMLADRLIDLAPQLLEQIQELLSPSESRGKTKEPIASPTT